MAVGDVCASCKHFDQESTELPICRLHRRFMSAEWTCGDHESTFNGGDVHAEAQKPAN